MQELGRSQAIQNIDAGPLMPALAEVCRQRFAGGHAAGERERAARGKIGAREERRIKRGHAAKDRRTVLDQALEHRSRRWPLGHEQCRRPDRKRECKRVAEAIGEKKLRRRKNDIVLCDAQDGSGVELRRLNQIGMQVYRALRTAGRAR